MISLPLHNRILALFALLFITSLTCLALYLDKPLVAFAGFALLAVVWLITRIEMLFYVLIASIPWSFEFNMPPLATDLPDEPIMLLTSFSLLLLLIAKRRTISARDFSSMIMLLLLLQFTWSVFAAITSTNQVVSFKFVLAKCWYLAAFVLTPVIIFRDRRIVKNTAIVLVTSMLLLCAVVMYRHSAAGFTFSEINPSLDPFFRNHVNYSALLACIFPLLIAFHLLSTRKGTKRFILLLILFTIVAVYFSYARGAWLSIIVSLAGWWLLKKRLLLAGYVVGILMVFASIGWLAHNNNYLRFSHDYQTTIFHEDFREHLVATYQFKDVSTAERFYRWIAGVRMVKDNWQTGFGPNTFPDQYKYYTVPAFKTWVSANEDRSTVHNYFLTMAIEQGLPGLLLLLLLLGYAFYVVQKVYHRTNDAYLRTVSITCAMLLCILCTVNFLSDLVETDKIGSIFYITLATIISLERSAASLIPAWGGAGAKTQRR